MTRFAEVIRGWLGWCPNARAMNSVPAILTVPQVTTEPVQPGGGAGGSGRIGRGARLAAGSIKILIRNKRLLWFSLLIGIVMVFSLATNLFIQVVSGTNPFPGTGLVTVPGTILLDKGSLLWFVLTFTTALISAFLTFSLLAGLITCVSYILSGRTLTLREGLSRAGNHVRTLAGWAVIGATMGTVLSFTTNNSTASFPVLLILMVATVIFGVLTLFVVPTIVMSNEGLAPAISKSVSLFRKTWGEIIVCAGIFFLICFGILLVAIVPISIIGFSSGSTAMVGIAVILYLLVMMVILFIGSTVVGIATLGLYEYGTTGIISREFEGKRM